MVLYVSQERHWNVKTLDQLADSNVFEEFEHIFESIRIDEHLFHGAFSQYVLDGKIYLSVCV